MTTKTIVPFSLKDAPALIEKVLPVQKLSADVYRERTAVAGQTLTALGSYWKGRKPLVLNKACILGALLPATADIKKDLEIFELLMGMDDVSVSKRRGLPKPDDVVRKLPIENIGDYFQVSPPDSLSNYPASSPFEPSAYGNPVKGRGAKIAALRWKPNISEDQKHELAVSLLPNLPYRKLVAEAFRAEEIDDLVHSHIWDAVNAHLGTSANSYPELTMQLGVMRFGHRPQVADTFSGSGQISFEAARLGCDVSATDLNPIACMLTWGALNVVGASAERRKNINTRQKTLVETVKAEIDALGVEFDGKGWRAKAYLYCLELTCPSSKWRVPVLSSRVVCKNKRVIVELVPDPTQKCYDIVVRTNASDAELEAAAVGTYLNETVTHHVNGIKHANKISSIRGDYTSTTDGKKVVKNKLRPWAVTDITYQPSDIYQERLYAIQWMTDCGSARPQTEYRSVTAEDVKRELKVAEYVQKNLLSWQIEGWIPDMKIEVGGPPRYQGRSLVLNLGWTHWNHAFNPRQLLVLGLFRKHINAEQVSLFTRALDYGSRMCHLNHSNGNVENVFYNQALNPLMDYGCRGFMMFAGLFKADFKFSEIHGKSSIENMDAKALEKTSDIFVTDPPFGDSVKYEEILDFFIAWLRKNPPPEFVNWVWDSRRTLAIKGEGDDFRKGMIAVYRRMTEMMSDYGLQIIMFTHQSGSIWADMANIIWAAGLQVTAAWYVVTETDSPLRDGSFVKGTILLILRKRLGVLKTYQGDLAWELEKEVNEQIHTLTGLNQEVRNQNRDDNLFSDADLQMAGYAAALRVLTKYSVIDGKDMSAEAQRPRIKGQKTLVDELIEYAVGVANQALVPDGIEKSHWNKLQPAERFYLKMLDLESQGIKNLDNYQNFAKAFKVHDVKAVMASDKANAAQVKSAEEFCRTEMNEASELYNTPLRGMLYSLMELQKDIDGVEVLTHLDHNIPNFHSQDQRDLVVELADYVSKKLHSLRPDEASAARVLRDLVRNQRM